MRFSSIFPETKEILEMVIRPTQKTGVRLTHKLNISIFTLHSSLAELSVSYSVGMIRVPGS